MFRISWALVLASLVTIRLTAQGFQQGPPLTAAETLIERVVLRAIEDAPSATPADAIKGVDQHAREIWVTCYGTTSSTASGCPAAHAAAGKLRWLVEEKGLDRPARTIRFVTLTDDAAAMKMAVQEPSLDQRVEVAIHIAGGGDNPTLQVVRAPWSRATIADEVLEVFARHRAADTTLVPVETTGYYGAGQPRFDAVGVPTLTLRASSGPTLDRAAFATASAGYFLASMPNTGSEALLSHLVVGAHSRLAEDGRRVVAQMGMGQRPSGDVLNTLAHAIEREQRRIRSVERYVPTPIDSALQARLNEMEKSVTGIWVSLGMSSAPFTPPAQRIRGRGGEDRRIPTLGKRAVSKLANSNDVAYEIVNLIDGKRSISDIRDAVSAEFGNVPLTAVVEYLELLARIGAVALR